MTAYWKLPSTFMNLSNTSTQELNSTISSDPYIKPRGGCPRIASGVQRSPEHHLETVQKYLCPFGKINAKFK